jgi:hypothetical protein
MLADAEYQAMYAASDGICLPHLRLAVEVADSEPGRRYLIVSTQARLAAFRRSLAEYTRKQAWQYRHETPTEYGEIGYTACFGYSLPLPAFRWSWTS